MTPSTLFNRMVAKTRLRHLKLLVLIADLQSLQKAADAIGMSQPGATHAIGELESILESRLFDRHAKGMRVTAAGAALLPLARKALGQIQAGAQAVAYIRAGASDTLRMGAINAAMSGVLADLLPEFAGRFPSIAVEVIPLGAQEIAQSITNDTVDIVVSRCPPDLPGHLDFIPLVPDRYAIVCGLVHPYASSDLVDLEDLRKADWLVPPPAGIAARDFEHLCQTLGMAPSACWVSAKSILLTLALLQKQTLLALIPRTAVIQLLDNGLLKELKCPALEPPPLSSLGLIFPRDKPIYSAATSEFIDFSVAQYA